MLCAVLAWVCAAGCVRQTRPDVGPPRLTLEEAMALVRPDVTDREGWALDALTALEKNKLNAGLENVCSVFAVVEQESGYKPNPIVEDLPRIVATKLESYAEKGGGLGRPALEKLLEGRARGSKETFKQRLKKAKTERDLDLVFRDLIRTSKEEHPFLFGAADIASSLSGRGSIAELNPITTAGSMQVSVRFAVEHTEDVDEDDDADEWAVRDALYTRFGGLYYGSARLLGYEAAYDKPVYRFADYNAGLYASRNAAVQDAVSELTGKKLVPDGDLLAYDKQGEPLETPSNSELALRAFRELHATWISEGALRDDLTREKTRAFEDTDTYRALKAAYLKKTATPLPYARVPDVAIISPKMKSKRTTKWFAENVQRRFDACLKRAP